MIASDITGEYDHKYVYKGIAYPNYGVIEGKLYNHGENYSTANIYGNKWYEGTW